MRRRISQFLLEETGATAMEYAFIASLISVVMFASAKYMGRWTANVFQAVGGNLTSS